MPAAMLLLTLQGCTKRAQPDSTVDAKATAEPKAGSPSSAELHDPEEPKGEVHAAARCAECHGELYAQWKESRHARAATSDLFVRMRKTANSSECARCHEPLGKWLESDHPASRDGVSCEACHTMATVELTNDGAAFRLRPEERTKFGPLCDAVDHYFHKMGCSPLHGESQFCASCHRWSSSLSSGGKLRVLGEYDEWQASGYAKRAVSCQDCHMPWQVAPVAAGAAARVNASHHGFRGEASDMRGRSLTVKTTIKPAGEQLRLEILVKNSGAGHYVPTGVPEHRVILETTVLDGAGRELEHGERSYAKTLVDAEGRPAPFFSAARELSDTRLAPEEERTEMFEFATPGAAAVKVRLVWMDVATEIARAIGHEPTREVMFEETHTLRPGKKGPSQPGATTPVMNR